MKQILQTGLTEVAEVPSPAVKRGQVLIRTSRTLVSAGTERMLLEFGKVGWIEDLCGIGCVASQSSRRCHDREYISIEV